MTAVNQTPENRVNVPQIIDNIQSYIAISNQLLSQMFGESLQNEVSLHRMSEWSFCFVHSDMENCFKLFCAKKKSQFRYLSVNF